jgi:hypothetical protein
MNVRRAIPAVLLVAVFMAACGSDGPSGPVPVGEVTVTATATSIPVGQTTQASAAVRDADGNVLSGRTVTWSSSNQGVATVDTNGLITGVSPGTTMISAAAEGRTGSIQIQVIAPSSVSITSISPGTLRAGESATIEGTGFATAAGSNVVTIGGERVNVTSATATSLQISIPGDVCLPGGSVSVQVRVGTEQSGAPTHPFENASAPLELQVGRLHLLNDANALCLRFGATGSNEEYLFGVQSFSSSPARVDAVRVVSATSQATAAAAGSTMLPERASSSEAPPPYVDSDILSPRGVRWQRHRLAEAELRRQDAALLGSLAARRRALPSATQTGEQALPANVAAGDTVNVRVPRLSDICNTFTEIRAVVRRVGQRGIWLDDVGNPPNGLSAADFQMLSQVFDDRIWTTNVSWFGEPSDLDNNQRIAIVTTKEVNKENNALGFVVSSDLLPRTGQPSCGASNEGEFYYARAADPTGQHGGEYTVEDAREDAVQLIGHEFTHIIQFSRRIFSQTATAFPTPWELEGQAVFAEEVNGHAATGRSAGQNYGFSVAFTGASAQAAPSDIAWYVSGFTDLALYYGFNVDGGGNRFRTQGAPEQCSWLGRESNGNTGPCLRGREVYGTPWTFLRWLTDHVGASYPGGPQAMHRALVDDNASGFATIENVAGEPMQLLLAQWAAMLYLDDRIGGLEPRLTLPSWNLVDIIDDSLFEEAHLAPRMRAFTGIDEVVRVRGGSSAYFRVSAAGRPATQIRMRQEDGARLGNAPVQVWVVRMR